MMEKLEEAIKNRPNNVHFQEFLTKEQIARIYDEWLEKFEVEFVAFKKQLPFKLDILAEQLFDYVGDSAFSVTWFKELVYRWADKQLLGVEETK